MRTKADNQAKAQSFKVAERGRIVTDALDEFRLAVYAAFAACEDALFAMMDALTCAPGRIDSLAWLSLAPEFGRGHDMLYQALSRGQIDWRQLRRALWRQELPRLDGRIVLAVDGTGWPRPDANTSNQRVLHHRPGRNRGEGTRVPSWAFSFLVALESGNRSWVNVVDAEPIRPGETEVVVAVRQIRRTVAGLIESGRYDPDVDGPLIIVCDSGYQGPLMAHQLAGLPVRIIVRCRKDRVWYKPAPTRGGRGRKPRHGRRFAAADARTWGKREAEGTWDNPRYGTVRAVAFDRLHQMLTRDTKGWADHDGDLPIIEGSAVRIEVDRLPNGSKPEAVWLWASGDGVAALGIDTVVFSWLRRFDTEHFFRFIKQDLSWTAPRIRAHHGACKWTAIVICAYTQLRLARSEVMDLRHRWERDYGEEVLPPRRVRRGFPQIRQLLTNPARTAKSTVPGSGRRPGSRNRRKAAVKPPGKPVKTG